MTMGDTSREELVARLQMLSLEAEGEKREHARLVHDLQVHQLELELQTRELRETQNALEESRNRHVDLYDFAPIAYLTFDAHGCILEINLTGATLIGRERRHLIGLPFISLVQLDDPARFWSHLRRCADARTSLATELAMTVRSAPLHVRAVSSPVADASGQVVAFRTAFIDVTERHLAERARNAAFEAEQALRHELEVLDRAKEVLAASLATMTDQSLPMLRELVGQLACTIANADHAEVELGASPAIGSGREALHVPIAFGNRAVGTLHVTAKRELTEDDRRTLGSLARYAGAAMEIARLGDEAQAAIRSRDNLLATVSHDLRSPLSAISISVRLLQRTLGSEDATPRRQADTISRATDRMTRLIDDLLIASTIDAGRLAIAAEPACLTDVVTEAVELFSYVAAESGLKIEAKLATDLVAVRCDRDRIHQVLANLIGNAIKFTPSEGRITVETARHGDEVRIAVRDTGCGIAEDVRAHVFERFWKGARDPNRQRGVGLGLYICKGIVESHHGRIWVESSGAGTTFTFSLPITA